MKPHEQQTAPEADRAQGATATGDSRSVVLEQYAAELFSFLAKRLSSRQEAEDLLQSIYLRFLQTPHADTVRQPRAYLYRIAANLLSEFRLRRKRDPVLFDSQAVTETTEQAPPADVWSDVFGDRLALQEQLARVLGQLPATYRAVLLLRVLHGASFKEIGARFGITEQSARKYLVRAMALCRKADWSR